MKALWKKKLVSRLTKNLERDSFQTRPYFPDLLRQPDLLTIPTPGRLIAVFIYNFSVSWNSVLSSVEDLFETKIHVGEQTSVVAYLVQQGEGRRLYQDALDLVRNSFDSFQLVDSLSNELGPDLGTIAEEVVPKARIAEFIGLEKRQAHIRLRRFSESRYRPLVEEAHRTDSSSGRTEKAIARRLSERLGEILGAHNLVTEPAFENVKGYVGDLGRQYTFRFDFGISDRPDIAIETFLAGRHGLRERLRSLMTKARLLGYEIVDNQLWPRRQSFRPILVVEGNIAGPSHDPYRYVRALVSVGWEIVRADKLEGLPALIDDANF